MGDWRNTLLAARQASDRMVSGISLDQINRVYLLQANILLENINNIGNTQQKLTLLRESESNLYQAIANMGIARDPLYIARIEDRKGNILEEWIPEDQGRTICTPENAGLMIEMLKGVVNEGTAAGLRMNYRI